MFDISGKYSTLFPLFDAPSEFYIRQSEAFIKKMNAMQHSDKIQDSHKATLELRGFEADRKNMSKDLEEIGKRLKQKLDEYAKAH